MSHPRNAFYAQRASGLFSLPLFCIHLNHYTLARRSTFRRLGLLASVNVTLARYVSSWINNWPTRWELGPMAPSLSLCLCRRTAFSKVEWVTFSKQSILEARGGRYLLGRPGTKSVGNRARIQNCQWPVASGKGWPSISIPHRAWAKKGALLDTDVSGVASWCWTCDWYSFIHLSYHRICFTFSKAPYDI